MRLRTIVIGTLLSSLLAPLGLAQAKPQELPAKDLIAQVQVVPYMGGYDLVDPAQVPILKAVAKLSVKERDRLLKSTDPKERGIGIFIADQQGDIKCLFSLAYLLTDEEPTVLVSDTNSIHPPYLPQKQTVRGYLADIYQIWFGRYIGSLEEFQKTFAGITNPDYLVNPWMMRLDRARSDLSKTTQIKRQIEELPENVRWAVISEGRQIDAYTDIEANRALRKLSRRTKEAILSGQKLLPNDPLFKEDSHYRQTVERAIKLMNETER